MRRLIDLLLERLRFATLLAHDLGQLYKLFLSHHLICRHLNLIELHDVCVSSLKPRLYPPLDPHVLPAISAVAVHFSSQPSLTSEDLIRHRHLRLALVGIVLAHFEAHLR